MELKQCFCDDCYETTDCTRNVVTSQGAERVKVKPRLAFGRCLL